MPEKKLSREQVVEELAKKTGLAVEQVKAVLQAQAEIACANVDRTFAIPGIGVLSKIDIPAHQMKMPFGPKAGQIITTRPRTKINFRVSRLARSRILDGTLSMPDLFRTIQISEFTFSAEASKLPEASTLETILGSPFRLNREQRPVPVSFYRLPDLHLPTGRIIACDGMIGGGSPFRRQVAPGTYPLFLGVAEMGGDERVAFAIIRFSDHRVAKWEPAMPEERENPGARAASNSYGVDSGTGSFRDEFIQELIDEAEDAEIGFGDHLQAESRAARRNTWARVHVNSRNGSMAVFSSGFGDGTYSNWFGLDDAGNPSGLLTDFQVVSWENRPTAE